MVLEFEDTKRVVESGGRVKVGRINRKPYLYLIYSDGHERYAGRLDRHPEDVRAWIENVRKPKAGAGGKS